MLYKKLNPRMFDEGTPAGGDAGAAAGASAQAAGAAGAGKAEPTYTFEQMDAIAEKKSRSAVASYLRQQGMSEDEITEAIKDYKAKKAAQLPDVDAITRERDAARAELEQIKRKGSLAKLGVSDDDAEFVLFKIGKAMEADKKLTFDKAAEKFLADNPRYAAGQGAYRVQTAPGTQSAHGSYRTEDEKYRALDEAVAAMFR